MFLPDDEIKKDDIVKLLNHVFFTFKNDRITMTLTIDDETCICHNSFHRSENQFLNTQMSCDHKACGAKLKKKLSFLINDNFNAEAADNELILTFNTPKKTYQFEE